MCFLARIRKIKVFRTLLHKIIFCILILFSMSVGASPVLLGKFPLPSNKQGIADRNYDVRDGERYRKLTQDLGIGIQKFNFYWANAEDGVRSSILPVDCGVGYTQFPQNKDLLKKYGLSHYHCYKNQFVAQWQDILKNNASYGMQAALVLWTAPEQYLGNACRGVVRGGRKTLFGCYPNRRSLDDYEDWVRFVALNFGAYVDHYIVWNEVEATDWAEVSDTELNINRNRGRDTATLSGFDLYADLLKRTIRVVDSIDKTCIGFSGECKPMVYVSLDRDWYGNTPILTQDKKGNQHIKWRNQNLMDYLWANIGMDLPWSVAIHPYGDAYSHDDKGLTFDTLVDFSAYQRSQIEQRVGKAKSWLDYPQSRIFASEQNVSHTLRIDEWHEKARFICQSYNIAEKLPQVIAITHNHFQGSIASEKNDGYSMLPWQVGRTLEQAKNYETYRAYVSTQPSNWGQNNLHYCCTEFGEGCRK